MYAAGVVRVSWDVPAAFVITRSSATTDMQVRAIQGVKEVAKSRCIMETGHCDVSNLPGDADITIGAQAINDNRGYSEEKFFQGIITWPSG